LCDQSQLNFLINLQHKTDDKTASYSIKTNNNNKVNENHKQNGNIVQLKHTESGTRVVGDIPCTNGEVVKAVGCRGRTLTVATGTAVLPDSGTVVSNTADSAAVDGNRKLFGWTGTDGCGKSRSPRRSTLLDRAVVAAATSAGAAAAGVSDNDWTGGNDGAGADSND